MTTISPMRGTAGPADDALVASNHSRFLLSLGVGAAPVHRTASVATRGCSKGP